MNFIHEILCFGDILQKNCSVFQKFKFSRFSIDRIYFLTDRNCDKKFDLNLPGSTGARLIESISRLIEA